ncbi:Mannosylglucosyl-3-phosphoglycerate phosphatase-like protein [Cladobotryum mycophilum]|uniref:Mannosylglucosyl-3-phosphoglycerate phosphatase-like protein n=1 Tax=Cladobotryum mycophilum TaxID=491253 RepID=A0ABR0SXE8_9HYPO
MAQDKKTYTAEPQVTYSSGRVESASSSGEAPDLRIVHYNDVYHVDQASAEPVGGLARFVSVCKEYKEGKQYEGQSKLLTFFAGDAFNPSLESSVTKGAHMVSVLNAVGTDAACVGNHDLDFGVKQFQNLAEKCEFPWLLANVLDPALGEDVPLGNAKKTHMLTTSNGIKVGLIGLGEREWLETINSLPPDVIYKSATAVAKELVPKLREEGAEIVICISHMREPNDNKLATQTDGIMDIILGGHDHYYNHSFINGTHVLRSGTDFKQLSYIEARRKKDDPKRWDFDIWRRDITSQVPEDAQAAVLVNELTSKLQKSLSQPVGWTAVPLDARFSTVRNRESNMGNFICDMMRSYHRSDCALVAGGTFRGDQIYPPGVLRIKDITACFPFEDPIVLMKIKGQAIRDALENGVSAYPKLEGRFPQVSGIAYEFDPTREPRDRITSLKIAGEPVDPERKYTMATRGYMGRGKDGYTALLVQSEGGEVEEIIDEESGILLSTMLRQYFMALRTVGQWKHLSDNWFNVAETSKDTQLPTKDLPSDSQISRLNLDDETDVDNKAWRDFQRERIGFDKKPGSEDEIDHHFDPTVEAESRGSDTDHHKMDVEVLLMKKFWGRWARRAGIKSGSVCDPMTEAECAVDWTRVISPVLDGRIKMVGS